MTHFCDNIEGWEESEAAASSFFPRKRSSSLYQSGMERWRGEGEGASKLLFYLALALVACGGSRCVNKRRSPKAY